MSTLRMADGAFPIATTLTPHPVGLVNLDQSPGSPTPISARLSLPPAASALFRNNGKDAAIMLEASPSFIRSRRVGAGKLSMLSSLRRVHPGTVRCFSLPASRRLARRRSVSAAARPLDEVGRHRGGSPL